LFIGEAPPPQAKHVKKRDQLNFFYNPKRCNNLRESLKELLSEAGFEEFVCLPDEEFLHAFRDKGFYLTDAIKCPRRFYSPSEKKKFLRIYRKSLLDEIRELEPEIIFVLGWVALHAIGVEESVTSLHGSIINPREINVDLPESVKYIIVSMYPNQRNRGRVEDMHMLEPYKKLRNLVT